MDRQATYAMTGCLLLSIDFSTVDFTRGYLLPNKDLPLAKHAERRH